MTRSASRGFTLLEMVIVLVMLALMTAIAGPYLSNGVQAFNDSAAAVHTLGKLRLASERLVRELREVRRNPAAPANYDISVGTMPLVFTKTDGETVRVNSAAPLLTLAYDSDKKTTDDELHQRIDPDAHYLVYEDRDGRRPSAPSA